MDGKVVIISAPSGAGKTTMVKHLLGFKDLNLAFSISACTRSVRDGEVDGRDYYFISLTHFRDKIDNGEFIEWEEVYKNHYYGTLKSEVNRIWGMNKHVLFDVDVMGGINLKEKFGEKALSIFVKPPSIEVLKQRLELRGTETPEKISNRINKASLELKFAPKFDRIILNDKLEDALIETSNSVKEFLIHGLS
jgi:guanylate kinase